MFGLDRAAGAEEQAANSRAKELGDAFREFEGVSSDIGDHIAAQQGAKAGAVAGMSPGYKPLSALGQITAYGKGYTAAASSTYITQAQLSLETSLSGTERDNTGDPVKFQAEAAERVQKAIAQIDPMFQPELTQWAQARIEAGVNRQADQKATDVKNTALSTYQQSVGPLTTAAIHTSMALPGPKGDAVIAKLEADDRDRLNALVASHVITPEQANTLHDNMVSGAVSQMTGARVDASLQPVLQTMRSNVEASDKLIVQSDPNLSPEENATRLHEYEQERQSYVQSQTQAHVSDLGAVHQQLAGGAFGQDVEGTLHSLYQAGALSQEGLYSGMAQSLRNQKKRIGDEADMAVVDHVLHGELPGPLDPQNKQQAAAVDKYFQEHIAQSGAVTDRQFAAGAAEIVHQTGIVPASVLSRIRIGLYSGNANRTVAAAALGAQIEGANPNANVYRTPHTAAFARLINDNLSAGLSPTDSYNMAVRTVNIPPEQRKMRDADYSRLVRQNGGNAQALADQLKQEGANVAPPIAMQSDYENLTRQFYDQTADIAKARDLAGQQLRQSWGPTTVNGSPQLMKWAPPASEVPTIRADIASSVKAAGYGGDPSTVHLVPNAETDATRGRSWSLVATNPATGVDDVLLDKSNRPLVYHTPSGPDFAKAQAALNEQGLARAREERDGWRQAAGVAIPFEQELSQQMLSGNAAQQRQAGR
ncbi:MAG TPA: hypothetical protein VHY36_11125 [Steroidobacteraceae bacterium]|nr:hypothetical protein [Steroidobacteraceae bacterium]